MFFLQVFTKERQNRAGLEAHEYRLRFEMKTPELFHALLNVLFQCHDVGGCGFPSVHDSQSMFARDPDSPAAVTLAEA